jgi:pyrrolidone-carboxylate peptidase
MRLLVYGFGPYRQYRDNITARIIEALEKQAGVRKFVMPVRFRRRQFVELLERFQVEMILGLGQSSRRRIEVESRARNQRRARKGDKARPIFRHRPQFLPTTLTIKAGKSVGNSKNAGDFVCNYSMYALLEAIARRGLPTRLGFVHVPHDYNEKKACRIVEKILAKCLRGPKKIKF